jgi:hypothetical protein
LAPKDLDSKQPSLLCHAQMGQDTDSEPTPLFRGQRAQNPKPDGTADYTVTHGHHPRLNRHIAVVPDHRVKSRTGRAGCIMPSPLASAGDQASGRSSHSCSLPTAIRQSPFLDSGGGKTATLPHSDSVTRVTCYNVGYIPYRPRVRRGSQIPRLRIILCSISLAHIAQGSRLSARCEEQKGQVVWHLSSVSGSISTLPWPVPCLPMLAHP